MRLPLLRLGGRRPAAREWSELDRLRAALDEADRCIASLLREQEEHDEPALGEIRRQLRVIIRDTDRYHAELSDLVDRPGAATSASTSHHSSKSSPHGAPEANQATAAQEETGSP